MADDDKCSNGIPAKVSGEIHSLNISTTTQVGKIHLTLKKKKKNLFDEKGRLVGILIQESPAILLNHMVVFNPKDTIRTSEDEATITGVRALDADGNPCSYFVTERIRNFEGTGFFKGAQGEVTATGYTSFCPGENGNFFELTGRICLRPTD